MPDDPHTSPTDPAPPPTATETDSGPSAFGVPLAAFVRGGTTTYRHDMQMKELEADAERRRDDAEAERKIANIPIEQGGGKMYTSYLQPNPDGLPVESAYVELIYLTPGGEPAYHEGQPIKCLADVNVGMDPLNPMNLTLTLVCQRCKENSVPLGQCQMRVHQSNRRWHLDTKGAGDLIIFHGKPYRSAGTVMDSERLTCKACGWSVHIDKNRVRPEA